MKIGAGSLSLLLALVAGCGQSGNPCVAASQHVAACTGQEAAVATGSCDSAAAEEVLSKDCSAFSAGKADIGGALSSLVCRAGALSYCDAFDARTGLSDLAGDWTLWSALRRPYNPGGGGCPEKLHVNTRLDPADPGLELLTDVKSGTIPAFYNGRFSSINMGRSCSAIPMSTFEDVQVCSETEVVAFRSVHEVHSLTRRLGVVVGLIPAGSSSAEQRLTLGDGGLLVYEYRIDGELTDACQYRR
jgi:hypothetical protein